MVEVRLRRWRLEDADDVAAMLDDEHLQPWSTMGADLEGWIRREVAEARGPSRAICLADDERALGRVAVRPPSSLHRRFGVTPFTRMTARLGS